MNKSPRLVVAKALLKLEAKDAWSNLTLDHALDSAGLEGPSAAFAGMLFYGVVERRLTLDACIAAHSKQPPHKLTPEVLCALRVGIYQILYMDGVPDHAAVAESVNLIRALRKTSASGFVNGVLRSFLRAGSSIPLPKEPLSARLSVEYSCPEPLVSLWLSSYGEDATTRFLADSLGRPPVCVRANTLRLTARDLAAALEAEGVTSQPHPDLPHALLLEHTGAIHKLQAYRQGLFHVQDPSSQLCAAALDPKPGHRVLDACAAPGGKTFTLYELTVGNCHITACDLYSARVDSLANRAAEMGFSGIAPLTCDMSIYHGDLGGFDRVLCDVPCSGYGVIRRKPEIKYKPLEESSSLPEIQYKLLENTSQYCKEGGRLVYSTCTLHPAENDAVCDRFLEQHPDFLPAPLGGLLGEAPRRTLMGEFLGDGFFLAAFQRGNAK